MLPPLVINKNVEPLPPTIDIRDHVNIPQKKCVTKVFLTLVRKMKKQRKYFEPPLPRDTPAPKWLPPPMKSRAGAIWFKW